VTPYKIKSRKSKKKWALDIPVRFSENGKRGREFFLTENEAEIRAKNLKKNILDHGRLAPRFSPGQSERLQSMIDLTGGIEQMESVIREWVKNSPNRETRIVKPTFDEYYHAKELSGVGKEYLGAIRFQLARFVKAFEKRELTSITPAEMTHWLEMIQGEVKIKVNGVLKVKPRPLSPTTCKGRSKSAAVG
jgi:hypothetical protein